MDLAQLPGLALIWCVAVSAPGPDMVLVLQQSIARSRRAGLLAAAGVTTGATVWLMGALFGLSALLQALPWLMAWLELLGGLLLVVIGATGLRSWRAARRERAVRDVTDAAPAPAPTASSSRAFLRGLATNLSNPKALVFFGAIFTPFLTGRILSLETAIVVAVLILLTAGWFCLVAITASAPRFAPVIDRFRSGFDVVASCFFVAVGLGFVLTALVHLLG
ncbi:LysE family translocator [Kocuria palustris]|uniref:LysE family translocator n=1 Tax=Kocuria palustris TaxID=71999 RepID=UPI0011A2D4C4|nr:LysE family transporter [Kocuria palustris]